jgi:hypothetical protein
MKKALLDKISKNVFFTRNSRPMPSAQIQYDILLKKAI